MTLLATSVDIVYQRTSVVFCGEWGNIVLVYKSFVYGSLVDHAEIGSHRNLCLHVWMNPTSE